MNAILGYVVARLKEPSTYAGLAGIALSLGVPASEWSVITNVAVAVFGGLAVVIPG